MTFADDLKLAGLQSFKDALDNPSFRSKISPEGILANSPDPENESAASKAAATGLGNLLTNAATYYSTAAQNAINGILGSGTNEGPISNPASVGGQCEVLYDVRSYIRTDNTNLAPIDRTDRVIGPVFGLRLRNYGSSNGIVILHGKDSSTNRPYEKVLISGGFNAEEYYIISKNRVDGQPDNCGNAPTFGEPPGYAPPTGANPDHPVNPGGNHPSTMRFGTPYLGNDGNLHVPFNVGGDGWALGGSFNPATGEWNFGPPLPEDEFGNPIGDPNRNGDPPNTPENEECDCVELERKVGEIYDRLGCEDDYPLSLPENLASDSTVNVQIETVPALLAYLLEQIDAVVGQFPFTVQIDDTDPNTPGNQTETIEIPNIAEGLAEVFQLVYSTDYESSIHTNMLMRLASEVVATKISSLVTQDWVQANASYLGYRTAQRVRKVPNNFNLLEPANMEQYLKTDVVEFKGVEEVDQHSVYEWLELVAKHAQYASAPVRRTDGQINDLKERVQSFKENLSEDKAQDWEDFIESLNALLSPINQSDLHPRPRAYSVDNLQEPTTPVPQP